MSIGVILFPCPKCSTPTPVEVIHVVETSRFSCGTCKFTRAFGETFPSVKRLLNELAHLAPDIARAKIVDAMTAWYLDWSDLRD